MGGENDRTKLFDSELKVMNVLWKEGCCTCEAGRGGIE